MAKRVESWVVTDEFWERVKPLIPARSAADRIYVRKPGAGRPPKPARQVLIAIIVKRKDPPHRRNKHLCADAGYRGAEHLRTIVGHGYTPHVVDHRKEADIKRRDPKKKARRWVVEVCHSWFNRFRKLLVRYEKLERSFVALNHLAAAIIAFRKVPLSVNIIYG